MMLTGEDIRRRLPARDAYRYVDGRIEEVDWDRDPWRTRATTAGAIIGACAPRNKRERRRWARARLRGRRGARRVQEPRDPVHLERLAVKIATWKAHRVARGRRTPTGVVREEYRLYLPEGVDLCQAHLSALEAALRRSVPRGTDCT